MVSKDDLPRILLEWSRGLAESLRVLNNAELAKQHVALGGAHPWQLSLVARPPTVNIVHWQSTASRDGRRCKLDKENKVVWPTACDVVTYPVISWKDDAVIHPAIGCWARRDKRGRGQVSADILLLKRIWEMSMDPIGKPHAPALLMCQA
eukprot:386112-Pyramimonas_sp.AAC.1